MPEPENHTSHLLREIRGAVEALDRKTAALDLKVDRLDEKVRHIEQKVDFGFARVEERFDRVEARLTDLGRALANEIIQGKFVTAGIDQRFAGLEGRVLALEETR